MDTDGMRLEPAVHRLWGTMPSDAKLTRLRGDASSRIYYRLTAPSADPASAIVMRLPDDALRSDEGDGSERASELPFLNVGRLLAQRGVRVPHVLVEDMEHGLVVLEDLGDETFEARLKRTDASGWTALYGRAVDTLVAMHQACAQPDERCLAYQRSFDQRLLRWELTHFLEWGLCALGHTPDSARGEKLDADFDDLVHELLTVPQGFVHRDYQSRNLMWVGDELVVIDFQDALLGPEPYDLVALLCDSYVKLDLRLQLAMIARYCRGRNWDPSSSEAFSRAFWLTAAQRKLKDAGRFVYIDQVRGNPDFLPFFAQSLVYAGRALEQSGRTTLHALLTELLPGFPDRVQRPAPATGSRRG